MTTPTACACAHEFGDCPICFEVITMANIAVTTCGHTFHSSCIFQNLEERIECPMCRTALVQLPDEEDEEEDEEEEEAEEVDPDGWETVSESEEDSVVDEDEDSVDAVDIEDTDSLFSTEIVPRNLDEEFALEQPNENSEDDYFNHEVTIVNAVDNDVEKNIRGFRRMAVQAKIFYEQQDMLKEQEAMAKEDFDASQKYLALSAKQVTKQLFTLGYTAEDLYMSRFGSEYPKDSEVYTEERETQLEADVDAILRGTQLRKPTYAEVLKRGPDCSSKPVYSLMTPDQLCQVASKYGLKTYMPKSELVDVLDEIYVSTTV